MYKLISATPSPYARKVRIALIEKGIPFELQTEVPWDNATRTPDYNPLEKLPVLIRADGDPIYESHLIMEYLERVHPAPALVPQNDDDWLLAKRLEVLGDGVCDAFVLTFFERMREASRRSAEWLARQRRKIDGGLREMERRIGDRAFFVGDGFTLGDIAAATAFGYLCVRWSEIDWRSAYPNLAAHSERMEARPSFQNSRPVPQKISDKVV
ncbi:MAG: glutathione S-transferase N-terminal domain-containing protein [Alphaproteobacteria bacterium]|nr:glutathione S-transferase N-terminal domain-containing protein [Alphaproteobacteria bacterium]